MQNEDKRGGEGEIEGGIMRMHEIGVKQDRKRRKEGGKGGAEEEEEASWRKSRWRRSFSVFHFNLYICGFPSETNVLCLLIVH